MMKYKLIKEPIYIHKGIARVKLKHDQAQSITTKPCLLNIYRVLKATVIALIIGILLNTCLS